MEDITVSWLPFTLPEWLAVPALTLGFLMASVNVFLFHILAARPERSALYFWPFALVGFAAGHFVGLVLDVPLGMLGDVYWLTGSIGAWLILALANAVGRP